MADNDLLPPEVEAEIQAKLDYVAKMLRESCLHLLNKMPSASDVHRQVESYIDIIEHEIHPEKRTKVTKVVPDETGDGYIVHLMPVNPIVFKFTVSAEEE